MSEIRRSRPSYASVVSTMALFVALGGTSYAAVAITGRDVKDGSLTGSDLKDGSVGSRDVKNGTLLAADFKAGQLPRGVAGPSGAAGLQGATGPAGPAGPAGASAPAVGLDENTATSLSSTTPKNVQVFCPLGTFALGGGYTIDDGQSPPAVNVAVTQSTSARSVGRSPKAGP